MPKLEQFPLDSRLREINLKLGKVTKEEITKHLKSLPDNRNDAEELVIQEDESDSASAETASSASAGTSDESADELDTSVEEENV